MAHTLPPLPYDYKALAPVIDEETMKIHHDGHHGAYVNKLNAALQGHADLEKLEIDTLLQRVETLPGTIRTAVRNNGGGHLNHSIFWPIMTPKKGGAPIADVTKELNKQFGSYEKFQALFQTTGEGHFGSGWVWLVRGPEGVLQVISTPNQDNPVMQGLYPVFGNDLWEHAYYLTYRNKRGEYLKNWWQVVNWEEVARRLDESMSWFKRKVA
jgi:Fe-Mn family superoxide dismutase